MHIREIDLDEDYNEIRRLWERSGPGVQLSPSDELEELRRKLEHDPDLAIVIEEEGVILGTVFAGYDGRRGIIYHLAVQPERRAQGIGKTLMNEIEDRLRAKGCYKYYLLVRRELDQALSFYQSLGCEIMDLHILGKVLR